METIETDKVGTWVIISLCLASCVSCGFMDEVCVCVQKERYIQISKVDEEERKRREQQKLEREQVSLVSGLLMKMLCKI